MSEYAHILLDKRDGVAHVILNRPEKRNALGFGPGSSRDEIVRALADADADATIGAIVLEANGPTFCAGGDLSGLPPGEGPVQDETLITMVDAFHAAIRQVTKPVIAAVNGACVGAGMGLIAQCDLVLAGSDARFGLPEGRFGHPGGSELVPLVGSAWAKFLILSGELIPAQTAVDIGLALAVIPADRLQEAASALAERMARLPREAMRLNKRAIDRAAEAGGRAAGRLAGRSSDLVTKSMSRLARAPDGRLFDDILKADGPQGLKQAQKQQFSDSWLETYVPRNA
jgi:enoyl-CoA hydratase/carnithine racemase